MTQETAGHRTILLLNPGLVILPARPGTVNSMPPFGAVLGGGAVDDHAAVAGVDAGDGKGQLCGDGLQSCHHQGLLPGQQGNGPGPAGAGAGGPNCRRRNRPCCPRNGPPGQSPGNPVGAYSSRRRYARNMAATLQVTPAFAPADHRGPYGFEQPVQGGRAGSQQPLLHLEVLVRMAVPFHGLHQVRQGRLQAFHADVV